MTRPGEHRSVVKRPNLSKRKSNRWSLAEAVGWVGDHRFEAGSLEAKILRRAYLALLRQGPVRGGVKLPKYEDGLDPRGIQFRDGARGWNACLAEVRRLNPRPARGRGGK